MAAENSRDQGPRYVVGIDLGTTNSAICFVDTDAELRTVETFQIPQLVASGQVESRETLPSFHYQPARDEFSPGSCRLPWQSNDPNYVVGILAREQGKLVPGRGTESAKSWLCHPGVDRTAPLLPWHAAEEVTRYSPVEVSAAYLEHMRAAWDHVHPSDALREQDVVLTLPASFDEVARELTIQAAKQAGLPRVVLLEEPQAAFYAWIDRHEDNWEQLVSPGQTILVCDVGGGTSDFTLIRVRRQSDGTIQFHRVAVGDHLILGGDNFDLALAQHLEARLTGDGKLEPRQWNTLIRSCRHAKEVLLSENAPELITLSLPGSGAKLIGGALQVELGRDEARELLLNGFFPGVPLDARPQAKRSGFQEFGLPYAADPAVTRHLAQFLWDHRHAGAEPDEQQMSESAATRPDVVLFNGGVFLATTIQKRIVESLQHWFGETSPDWAPMILENPRHDLAVAQGAAYYGLVRRGQGVRIAAGLARTYYIGVAGSDEAGRSEGGNAGRREGETEGPRERTAAPVEAGHDPSASLSAICLMPAGAEPGTEITLEKPIFDLTVAAPVEFPLFYSSTRLTDRPGEILPVDRGQMSPLPPIRTVLRQRKAKESTVLPVQVHAALNEIGLLQLWCSHVDGPGSWQLQFDVRAATQTEHEAHVGVGEAVGVLDESSLAACREILQRTFETGQERPGGLPKRIAQAIELSRDDWPPTLLRNIWLMLMDLEAGRKHSADHESRWLNLLGFSLRPGFGVALDDWRVEETWKQLRGKLLFPSPQCLAEWWVLWRRIGGGLTSGQQQSLATPLLTGLKDKQRKLKGRKGKAGQREGAKGRPRGAEASTHEEAESWRMLGSLELLPPSMKIDLGRLSLAFLEDAASERIAPALAWAVGRIGARQPLYGPLNGVVPPDEVIQWIDRLFQWPSPDTTLAFAITQLSRRTGDRFRDLPESKRAQVIRWLERHRAPEHFATLVREGGEISAGEGKMVFGESLPIGLRIR